MSGKQWIRHDMQNQNIYDALRGEPLTSMIKLNTHGSNSRVRACMYSVLCVLDLFHDQETLPTATDVIATEDDQQKSRYCELLLRRYSASFRKRCLANVHNSILEYLTLTVVINGHCCFRVARISIDERYFHSSMEISEHDLFCRQSVMLSAGYSTQEECSAQQWTIL